MCLFFETPVGAVEHQLNVSELSRLALLAIEGFSFFFFSGPCAVQGEQMETLQVGQSSSCSGWQLREEELCFCSSCPSLCRVANITVLRVINGPAKETLTAFTVQ